MGKKEGRQPPGPACEPSLKSFLLSKAGAQEGPILLPFAKERTPARGGWLASPCCGVRPTQSAKAATQQAPGSGRPCSFRGEEKTQRAPQRDAGCSRTWAQRVPSTSGHMPARLTLGPCHPSSSAPVPAGWAGWGLPVGEPSAGQGFRCSGAGGRKVFPRCGKSSAQIIQEAFINNFTPGPGLSPASHWLTGEVVLNTTPWLSPRR